MCCRSSGAPVKRERLPDWVDPDSGQKVEAMARDAAERRETIETLDLQDRGMLDNTQIYVVPPDRPRMMGDNHDSSTDSRVLNQVGYVAVPRISSARRRLFSSLSAKAKPAWQFWRWPWSVRWTRLFSDRRDDPEDCRQGRPARTDRISFCRRDAA